MDQDMGEKSARLTCDDGPSRISPPSSLDMLGDYGIPARILSCSRQQMPIAASHLAVVRRVAAEGHEHGNHTFQSSQSAPLEVLSSKRSKSAG